MSGGGPTDELLERAFRLAYFILGDRMAAIYLAMTVMDKLKTASTIQGRRFSYAPAARRRVSLGQLHLLQRLVCTEAEPFERALESQERPLRQHDMLIRYVKHLVMTTTKRNSFYVALGLCRLLHNYTTAETAEIYSLVMQNPDRGRDDYYYRSRKRHLLRELQERFGDSLKTVRGHRGEERFETEPVSAAYGALVGACLSRFTPWESACVLPAQVDPTGDLIAPFHFDSTGVDGEHEIELNRMHTLLHPACFQKLVSVFGLDAPRRRLEVPRFLNASDDGGLTDDRLSPEGLSGRELDSMRRYLEKNAARRRNASKSLLAVLVDGGEWARIEVARSGAVEVPVAAESELIELRSVGAEDEVTLALHPLTYTARGRAPYVSTVALDARHRASFAAGPTGDSSPGNVRVSISADGWDKRAVERVLTSLRRLRAWPADWSGGKGRLDRPALALGSLLAVTVITGFLLYRHSSNAPPGGRLIAEREAARPGERPPAILTTPGPTPQTHEEPPARGAAAAPQGHRPKSPRNLPRGAEPTPRPDGGAPGEFIKRAPVPVPTSTLLLNVRKVYVDSLGGGPAAARIREEFLDQLRASGRFTVVEDREEADAVFKGSAGSRAGGVGASPVVLKLVNARGAVVWAGTAGGPGGRADAGRRAEPAAELMRDLISDIKRLEGSR